jgi:hypothetical protein
MERFIKQIFADVDDIGPYVREGRYDLFGLDGEIILPSVWERMVQPNWNITMHMWPMPEPPLPSNSARSSDHEIFAKSEFSDEAELESPPAEQETSAAKSTVEKLVRRVVALGFTADEAREALRLTDMGNGPSFERAVDLLGDQLLESSGSWNAADSSKAPEQVEYRSTNSEEIADQATIDGRIMDERKAEARRDVVALKMRIKRMKESIETTEALERHWELLRNFLQAGGADSKEIDKRIADDSSRVQRERLRAQTMKAEDLARSYGYSLERAKEIAEGMAGVFAIDSNNRNIANDDDFRAEPPRVKSETRSQSMAIWWAERKARKQEEDKKNGTPTKTTKSRTIRDEVIYPDMDAGVPDNQSEGFAPPDQNPQQKNIEAYAQSLAHQHRAASNAERSRSLTPPESLNPVPQALPSRTLPTYVKIHRNYLDVATLHYYDLPYEIDSQDPNFFIVLRGMSKDETDVLFEHTKRLRTRDSAILASETVRPQDEYHLPSSSRKGRLSERRGSLSERGAGGNQAWDRPQETEDNVAQDYLGSEGGNEEVAGLFAGGVRILKRSEEQDHTRSVVSSTDNNDVADDDGLQTNPPLLRTNSGKLVEPPLSPPSRRKSSNKSLESEHADLTDKQEAELIGLEASATAQAQKSAVLGAMSLLNPPKDLETQGMVEEERSDRSHELDLSNKTVTEGVTSLGEGVIKGKTIPENATRTRIDRRLVNPEALEEANERFEEHMDHVIVLRVLSHNEIQALADLTKEIRERRGTFIADLYLRKVAYGSTETQYDEDNEYRPKQCLACREQGVTSWVVPSLDCPGCDTRYSRGSRSDRPAVESQGHDSSLDTTHLDASRPSQPIMKHVDPVESSSTLTANSAVKTPAADLEDDDYPQQYVPSAGDTSDEQPHTEDIRKSIQKEWDDAYEHLAISRDDDPLSTSLRSSSVPDGWYNEKEFQTARSKQAGKEPQISYSEDEQAEPATSRTRTYSPPTPTNNRVVHTLRDTPDPRFHKNETVHMSTLIGGARVKGVYTVLNSRYNNAGYTEYQLVNTITQKLYSNDSGTWVLEQFLRQT